MMASKQKLVQGWGINDADYSNWQCSIYKRWQSMIKRCNSPNKYPTYVGCQVDERWKSFMAFRAWYLEQAPKPGEQLDKDFLGDGKLYSPETCCFIPQELNKLFTDHGVKRGKWPQGVCKQALKYRAMISRKSKRVHLGYFNTPEEASAVYLRTKEAYMESLILENPHWPPRLVASIWCKMVELIEREQRLWNV